MGTKRVKLRLVGRKFPLGRRTKVESRSWRSRRWSWGSGTCPGPGWKLFFLGGKSRGEGQFFRVGGVADGLGGKSRGEGLVSGVADGLVSGSCPGPGWELLWGVWGLPRTHIGIIYFPRVFRSAIVVERFRESLKLHVCTLVDALL